MERRERVKETKRSSAGGSAEPLQTVQVPMLDLSREYAELIKELSSAIKQVFERQDFILGTEVAAFEAAAAARCGSRFAVGCASGSDALWLALMALGIGENQCVITTPFSFFSTASSILRAGARPIFADIDPSTLVLDPARVREALGESSSAERRISAVLPVHLYGQTVCWTEFEQIQQEFNSESRALSLVEDAAQAFGARWQGRPAGSLGTAAAFSFYPTKNLGAAGDAGMVTTQDAGLAERLRLLRAHGMRQRYLHEEIGWNSRLDTLQAAVLNVKLQYLDRWNEQRRRLAANYRHLFAAAGLAEPGPYPERSIVLPTVQTAAEPVFHQFVIRATHRDQLRSFLLGRKIGSAIYYPIPLHLQPALKFLGYHAGDFPQSERAASEVLALPIFPQLQAEEQEAVVAAIAGFYNQ